MRCLSLLEPRSKLVVTETAELVAGPGQVLVQVTACGVCRTDLHVIDGELSYPKLPLIPGHEVVGVVAAVGAGVTHLRAGTRVGVPWLGYTCGRCQFCTSGRENLCERARFTGYTLDGGYAEQLVADARYCFELPDGMSEAHLAPLMCAGLIGYRSLKLAGEGERIGLYGFGAAAHLALQVLGYQKREIYAFVRPGDERAKAFATKLGASWVGDSDVLPPRPLDAAIIYAPIGGLVPQALRAVLPGGRVVCAGIHMSDIPSFPYELLWHERTLCSVANLTRLDGEEFLRLATSIPIETTITEYALVDAEAALDDLRRGNLVGAAVLRP